MAICWSCKTSEYYDYKDSHGIRCPRCGQKKKDDPAFATKVVVTEAPKKAPVKRVARSKT